MKNTGRHYIIDRGCTGCDTCRGLCPVGAIAFGLNGASIDQKKCIGCGTCMDNCASEAVRELAEDEFQSMVSKQQ